MHIWQCLLRWVHLRLVNWYWFIACFHFRNNGYHSQYFQFYAVLIILDQFLQNLLQLDEILYAMNFVAQMIHYLYCFSVVSTPFKITGIVDDSICSNHFRSEILKSYLDILHFLHFCTKISFRCFDLHSNNCWIILDLIVHCSNHYNSIPLLIN